MDGWVGEKAVLRITYSNKKGNFGHCRIKGPSVNDVTQWRAHKIVNLGYDVTGWL